MAGGCAFCAIVAGDAEAHLVFEDEASLAFLDARPLFAGHTLLVPREHHETLADLPGELVEPLFANARRLSIAMLRRAAQRDVPTVMARALNPAWGIPRHRQVDHYAGVREARIASVSHGRDGGPRPFPVEVDGDYIGAHTELELGIEPRALTVVA